MKEPNKIMITSSSCVYMDEGPDSLAERYLFEKDPEKVLRNAVKGMLPKNRLNRKIINKLKVYSGENHPHEAQNPEVIN